MKHAAKTPRKKPEPRPFMPYLRSVRMRREDIESFEVHPFDVPVIRCLEELAFHPKVTFIVGENGTGKSTLLEAIAVAAGFNPEGGSINFHFATCESHSPLHEHITLSRGVTRPKDGYFLRAESYYNVASEIDRLDKISPLLNYGGGSLHEQSHGESFFALLDNRMGGQGLYVLDEPEAALSPIRQIGLLHRIHELVEQDSQFIIATHSPIVMAYPDSILYVLTEDRIERKPYEETDHYQVARAFLNRPDRFLKEILEPSETTKGD